MKRQKNATQLPPNSLEGLLREIGVTDLADVRSASPEADFELVSVQRIDTKIEGDFPLFIPSKDGFSKEHIYLTVGNKTWALLSVEKNYRVGQCIVTCIDATPGSTSYAMVPASISFLNKMMAIGAEEIEYDESPRGSDALRKESWFIHMRRAVVANHIR